MTDDQALASALEELRAARLQRLMDKELDAMVDGFVQVDKELDDIFDDDSEIF